MFRNAKNFDSSFSTMKNIAALLCLSFLNILLIFSSTSSWAQILEESHQDGCEKKLTYQYLTVGAKSTEGCSVKPLIIFKRAFFLLREGSKKDTCHSHKQIKKKIQRKGHSFQSFLTDRSYHFLNLSVLSAKHHPPTSSLFFSL